MIKKIVVNLLVFIGCVAVIGAWYVGLPWLVYWISGGVSLSLCFAVWYGLLVTKLLIKNAELRKQLKQYEAISNILKGEK